jgi:CTP-dependent riboflavin kinase
MNEHDYLLQERQRKIKANDLMSDHRLTTSQMRNGVMVDTTEEGIAANKEHIAEIEEILTTAGITFED